MPYKSIFSTTETQPKKTGYQSIFGNKPVLTTPAIPADQRSQEGINLINDMIKSGQANTSTPITIPPRELGIKQKILNSISTIKNFSFLPKSILTEKNAPAIPTQPNKLNILSFTNLPKNQPLVMQPPTETDKVLPIPTEDKIKNWIKEAYTTMTEQPAESILATGSGVGKALADITLKLDENAIRYSPLNIFPSYRKDKEKLTAMFKDTREQFDRLVTAPDELSKPQVIGEFIGSVIPYVITDTIAAKAVNDARKFARVNKMFSLERSLVRYGEPMVNPVSFVATGQILHQPDEGTRAKQIMYDLAFLGVFKAGEAGLSLLSKESKLILQKIKENNPVLIDELQILWNDVKQNEKGFAKIPGKREEAKMNEKIKLEGQQGLNLTDAGYQETNLLKQIEKTKTKGITFENIKTKPELFQQTRSLEKLQGGGFEEYKVGEVLKNFDEKRLLDNPITVGDINGEFVVTSGHNRLEMLKRAKQEGLLTKLDSAYINVVKFKSLDDAVKESIESNIRSKSVKDINAIDLLVKDKITESQFKNALAYDENKIKYLKEVADTFKNNNLQDFWDKTVGRELSTLKGLDFGVMQEKLNFVNQTAKQMNKAIANFTPKQAQAVKDTMADKIAEVLKSGQRSLKGVGDSINKYLQTIETGGFNTRDLVNLFGETISQTEVAAKSKVQVLKNLINRNLKSTMLNTAQRTKLQKVLRLLAEKNKGIFDFINANGGMTITSEKTIKTLNELLKIAENKKNNVFLPARFKTTTQIIAEIPKKYKTILTPIYQLADKAKIYIDNLSSKIASKYKAEVHVAGLKGSERVLEKVLPPVERGGYGGDFNKNYDYARNSIVIKKLEDAAKILEDIKKTGNIAPGRVKDFLEEGNPGGYHHIVVNVKAPNGHIAEIQITTPEMFKAKIAKGDALYDEWRVLDVKERNIEESKKWLELDQEMHQLYGDAWDRDMKSFASDSEITFPSINQEVVSQRNQAPLDQIKVSSGEALINRPSQSINRVESDINVIPSTPILPQVKADVKERGFITTVKEKMPELRVAGQYIPRSTDELAIKAKNLIKSDLEAAERIAMTKTDDGAIAIGTELLKHYQIESENTAVQSLKNILDDKAAELANTMARNLTELGRSVQAASILGRMTPEGQIRFAAREIQKYNETIKFGKKIPELTKEQIAKIRQDVEAIREMPDTTEKAMKIQELQNYVSDLVPTPLWKKMITIWKAGLLTGIKTSGLNILSNVSHFATEIIKDVPAVVVDNVASLFTGKRTLGLTVKGIAGGIEEGFQKGWRYLKTGFDERNIAAKLDYKRISFGKSKVAQAIKKYEETIFHIMGAEDQPFYYAAKARSLQSQAIAKAKNAGLRGVEAKKFVDELVSNPNDEMLKYAVLDAETAVYQNQTYLGQAARAIQKTGVGEVIIPFGRTPSAVAMQIINYSPIGIVKTIVSNIGKGKFDQRLFSQGIGRGLVGTGILFVGAELFKNNIIALDRPTGEREQKLWELEGKQANSIKINGKWRTVQTFGPAGNLLLVGGHFQKALNKSGSPTEAMVTALAGGAKSFSEQTFLRGMSQTIDALVDPQRSAEGYAGSTLGSTIPTIVSDVARAIDDKERRAENIGQKFQARVPFLRESLEPQITVFGQERDSVGNWLEIMADPTRPSPIIISPMVSELRRLTDAGFPVSPTLLGDKKGYSSLTPKQNTELWKRAGEIAQGKITNVMASPKYNDLPDDKRAKIIDSFIDKAKIVARAEMMVKLTKDLKAEELKATLSELKKSGLMTREVFDKFLELR